MALLHSFLVNDIDNSNMIVLLRHEVLTKNQLGGVWVWRRPDPNSADKGLFDLCFLLELVALAALADSAESIDLSFVFELFLLRFSGQSCAGSDS